jgi:ABC-type oligopeptide transport system substrate-binding subunit/class 3 adenylate cyclase
VRLQRLVPKEYAERLLATRGQVQPERRVVTILFSDVKGSTAMAEALDPEDWAEIMNSAFEFLIPPVYRYEGTLTQLMGDAILAFFGAPIAHEDDPERAMRAALEIIAGAQRYAAKLEQERGIKGFNVRVGVNTGLVVVGELGSDLRVAYTAIGDAINLAARMETAAEPGTILITEATHKLIAPLFETESLGRIEVKGKAEPVSVYRVLAAKAAVGKVRGIAGLESPLVGREAELAALQEAVERLRAGVGGIVTIVGEAGIGKSRLVAEARAAGAVHGSSIWIEGRCLSYGSAMAYGLWLDVLRALLRLRPERSEGLLGARLDDSPEVVHVRLQQQVEVLCPQHFDEVYPYLGRLMALRLEDQIAAKLDDMDGLELKAATFRAIETLIQCAASQQPLALVCEDLHWADPVSIELLERLLAVTDRAALLFICVFRPDPQHGSWRLREVAARQYRHRHTDLWLQPLSSSETHLLVGNLLRIEQLHPTLKQRIFDAAEGNPFYIEEIIRSLIDQQAIVRDEASGSWQATELAIDIPIPDTLQGVLMARIDRLQEDTKRVLQMASVIGRLFLYRVLEAIAEEERRLDEHLLTLQREEMIRERARIPELEYIFKHELTREAAYSGLLKKERRAFHRQVAEALERLFPERIDEQLGLLAHHWERAEDAEKATEYLLRAGDQARLVYAHQEAIDFYQRTLHFLEGDEDPERAARTWMKLGMTYHTAFDFRHSREAYDKGFSLWQQAGHVPLTVGVAPHALRVQASEPISLDPSDIRDGDSAAIIGQLFSALVQFTAELDVLPDAARSWEILDSGLTYVFHLREGVLWSDGQPVTAHDFVCSIHRSLEQARRTGADVLWVDIKGVKAFLQGELVDVAQVGVLAHDDRSLVIELEEPASHILQQLTQAYAVPRHAVAKYGEAWTDAGSIVTNGPFRLQAREPGRLLVLERNAGYGGRFPGNVQRIEVHIRPEDPAKHLDAYERGELDATDMNPLLPPDIARARHKHAADYVSAPAPAVYFIGFDLTRPPFDDVRVRRAFALSVDREFVTRRAEDYVPPATGGVIPPGMPGHSADIALPHDPQAGRALLAEAGYGAGGGLGFPRVEVCYPTYQAISEVVEHFVSQWQEQLGVQVFCESMEWQVYLQRVAESMPHLWYGAWVADYPDPDTFLRVGLASFRRGWPAQPYEQLLEAARRITDQPQRLQLHRQADRMVIEQAVVLPFAYGTRHCLVKPWVKRYPLFYIGAPLWKRVVIEPH